MITDQLRARIVPAFAPGLTDLGEDVYGVRLRHHLHVGHLSRHVRAESEHAVPLSQAARHLSDEVRGQCQVTVPLSQAARHLSDEVRGQRQVTVPLSQTARHLSD